MKMHHLAEKPGGAMVKPSDPKKPYYPSLHLSGAAADFLAATKPGQTVRLSVEAMVTSSSVNHHSGEKPSHSVSLDIKRAGLKGTGRVGVTPAKKAMCPDCGAMADGAYCRSCGSAVDGFEADDKDEKGEED